MSRFELWSYNEYGDGSIVNSSTSLEDVVNYAKKYVTEANVENALGIDDKGNSWELYFPVVFEKEKPSKKVIYAGDRKNGLQAVWSLNKDKKWEWKEMPANTELRMFLGNIPSSTKKKESSEWWLQDVRKKTITSLKEPSLHGKTVLFIKVSE